TLPRGASKPDDATPPAETRVPDVDPTPPPGTMAPPPQVGPVPREPTVAIDRPRPVAEPVVKAPSSVPVPVIVLAVAAVLGLLGLLASYLLADEEDDPTPSTTTAYQPAELPTGVEAEPTPV